MYANDQSKIQLLKGVPRITDFEVFIAYINNHVGQEKQLRDQKINVDKEDIQITAEKMKNAKTTDGKDFIVDRQLVSRILPGFNKFDDLIRVGTQIYTTAKASVGSSPNPPKAWTLYGDMSMRSMELAFNYRRLDYEKMRMISIKTAPGLGNVFAARTTQSFDISNWRDLWYNKLIADPRNSGVTDLENKVLTWVRSYNLGDDTPEGQNRRKHFAALVL